MSGFRFDPTVALAFASANGDAALYTAAPAGTPLTVAKGFAPRPKRKFGMGLRGALAQGAPGNWISDHRAETDKYTGWTYIAITAIAEQASQAECTVYQDGPPSPKAGRAKAYRLLRRAGRVKCGTRAYDSVRKAYGDEEAQDQMPDDHPLVKLLRRPNPTQTGSSFRFEQVLQLRLTGTCLIWNVPNQMGKPVERYVIPTAVAQAVAPCREFKQGGYRIDPASARNWAAYAVDQGFTERRGWYRAVGEIIPIEQIQTIRYPHPLYKDDGNSPVSASALWLDTAEAVDKSQWSQVRNGATPSGMLAPDKDAEVSEHELDRFADKANKKYAGVDNAGRLMFAPGGTVFTPFSTTPRDMVYSEARKDYRDMILAIHRVPAIVAGISEGGSYAAFVASLRQFVVLTVQPLLNLLGDEDTEQLAPFFGAGLTVEYEAVMVDDPQQIETMLQTDISAKARTVNEHRAERGLPPLDGEAGEAMVGQQAPPQQGGPGGFGGPPGAGGGLPGDGNAGGLMGQQGGDPGLLGGDPNGDAGGTGGQPGGGEFMDKGRRTWTNASRSRDEVLAKLEEGVYKPERAVVELTMLGITEPTAQKLVQITMQADAEEEDENDGAPVQMTAKSLRRFVEAAVRKCGGKGGKPGPCPVGEITDKHGEKYQVVFDAPTRTYEILPSASYKFQGRGVTLGGATMKHNGESVMSVGIVPDMRRRGIASGLYQVIEAHIGKKLKENWATTPDGEAFWASRKKSMQGQIARAAASTDTGPLPDWRKESGQYAKGRVRIQGLDISIENPKGSTRSGVSPDGEVWEQELHAHYGYIHHAKPGADYDPVDIFIGPDPENEMVYVVDQLDKDGGFDEHKVLLGWGSERAARAGYAANYAPGWRVGPMTAMTVGQFKEWLDKGDTTVPLAPELAKSLGMSEGVGTDGGALVPAEDALVKSLVPLAMSFLAGRKKAIVKQAPVQEVEVPTATHLPTQTVEVDSDGLLTSVANDLGGGKYLVKTLRRKPDGTLLHVDFAQVEKVGSPADGTDKFITRVIEASK